MEFLFGVWFGMPIWVWAAFLLLILAILYIDLAVLHQDAHEVSVRESALMAAACMGLAVAFSGVVWYLYYKGVNTGGLDPTIAGQLSDRARAWTAWELYMTGWVVEQTLAFDNIFVMSLIFGYFAVPSKYQHRVLFWGIIGVIVLRAIMIAAGAALIQHFHWLLYVFSAFLVFTGIKMLWLADHKPDIAANPILRLMRRHMRITDQIEGERFFVRRRDPTTGMMVNWATPLFVCLVLIEFADLIFAVELGAGDLRTDHRSVHCVYVEHLRDHGPALTLLRAGIDGAPLPLPEICLVAGPDLHRRQDIPAAIDR